MEGFYRKTYEISDMHLDCFGRVKPSVLLYFAQETAGHHCELLKLDWQELAKLDLFWAVLRHRVQVNRLPGPGEKITVETWPMPTTRSAFPRATVGYDSRGNELFRVISLWVLMNIHTRAMVLPGKSGVDVPGILRGNELSAPGSIVPKVASSSASRTVGFVELDRNGHMNNTRYLDWVVDLLPSGFHREHPVKEFTVCYLQEALEGQQVTLDWELSEEGILQVDGHRPQTPDSDEKTRVFSAKVQF